MIRVLSVPPFDALDAAVLPRRTASDPATRETVARSSMTCSPRGDDGGAGVHPSVRRGRPRARATWALDSRSSGRRRSGGSIRCCARRSSAPWTGSGRTTSISASRASTLTRGGRQPRRDEGDAARPGGTVCAGRQGVLSVVGHHERRAGPGGGGPGDRRGGSPRRGVTDAVLAACALSGVTRIFRVGGAQADRGARLWNGDDPAGGQDRRPRQPLGGGGQATGGRGRWAST